MDAPTDNSTHTSAEDSPSTYSGTERTEMYEYTKKLQHDNASNRAIQPGKAIQN